MSEPDLARQARGRFGEGLVARWYERQGYRVLARNWRCPVGEVDLVLGRDVTVVFCEVKARRTDTFGPPSLAVGYDKQRRLRRLAAIWLAGEADRTRFGPLEVRFDVAEVVGAKINVIEGAF